MLDQLENIQKNVVNDEKNSDYYIVKIPTSLSQQKRWYYRISQFSQSFQSKDRFNGWYRHLALQDEENQNLSEEELIKIGEKKGNKKKNDQAKKGTRKHKHIEEYFTKANKYNEKEWIEKLENFYPFVKLFNPFCLERKIFYENTFNKFLQPVPNGRLLGLAGTFDALGEVDCRGLSFEKGGEPISNKKLQFLLDWKYPSQPKYPVKKSKNNKFYPLIPYGIQLSCYIAAINQRTNGDLNLDKAIVVTAPEDSQTCYPYFFSKKAIEWYWENAKKMMVAIAYDEKKHFDYQFFEKETYRKGFHGRRLYIR